MNRNILVFPILLFCLISFEGAAQNKTKVSQRPGAADKNAKSSPGQVHSRNSKNLFNINSKDVQLGSFIYYITGAAKAEEGYNATGYIPVTAGKQYTLSYKHQIAWYNAAKEFISGSDWKDTNKTQTAPAGAKYLRCSVDLYHWNTFQVVEGDSLLPYENYGKITDNIAGERVNGTTTRESSITPPVIAPKIYVPRGRELSIYRENIHRYYDEEGKGKTDIRLGSLGTELTVQDRSVRYKQTAAASLSAVQGDVNVYNRLYELITNVKFLIQPVDQSLTTAKKIMNFGDSYTYRSTFTDAILASPAAANLTFYGIRKSVDSNPVINHEGRGGWTMFGYHSTSTDSFNPFVQPQDPYKYYGNTNSWITAFKNPTDYESGNMDKAITELYNPTTGLLIKPAVNDVMYVNKDSAYKRWDGSSWVPVASLSWSFNFPKYRSLFNCPVIDIIHVLLGTNDFAAITPATFDATYRVYKSRYDTMIQSFKSHNPKVKIIVGIPVPSGKQGEGTFETERRKDAYWLLARKLVSDYGNREAEGIYLADYHSTVDRIYGYETKAADVIANEVKPFERYTGAQKIDYIRDYAHLSKDGFLQMGDIYWGIIQALR